MDVAGRIGRAGWSMTIAVAGGGIAGLAAAIALARTGREVAVYERMASFAEIGAGVQIGPNGVRALQALGAWNAVAAAAVEPQAIVLRDGVSGRVLNEIPLAAFAGRYGAPYCVIHRGDLLAGLVATARTLGAIELKPGTAVAGVETANGNPALRLASGDLPAEAVPAEAVPAEAVIGADGLHSIVRAALLGAAPPAYAGHVLYRALVPIEAVPDSAAADVCLWLCPGGHVVHYPVSGGRQLNIVAAAASAWTGQGWGAPAEPGEVLGAFQHAAPALAGILGAAAEWRRWAAADRPPVDVWGRGAVTLIGDAAHPVLPYLAQGAVMALEDAVVLGRAVAAGPGLVEALRAYEALRRPRVIRLARLSRRQGSAYHLKGPMRLARNAVIAAMPVGLLAKRLDWVYGWQPDT